MTFLGSVYQTVTQDYLVHTLCHVALQFVNYEQPLVLPQVIHR